MPNPIKYTTGSETLALKKGDFYIGTGDVGKGPTSTTGYFNGITPPSGGYTIYLNKESGGPSIYTASNDAQLISLTNSIAGESFTSATQCLVYFAGQTDKICVNRDYEGIVTDGLVLNLDAGFTPSYPRSGTAWSDVGGSNNGTLTNGPTFNSADGGLIVYDGVDDYVVPTGPTDNFWQSNWTVSFWINFNVLNTTTSFQQDKTLLHHGTNSTRRGLHFSQRNSRFQFGLFGDDLLGVTVLSSSTWYNVVFVLNNTSFLQQIYMNGNLSDFRTANGTYTGTGNNTRIGGPILGFGSYFDGYMSHFNAYNRILSAAEILQNYNAQKGRFGL